MVFEPVLLLVLACSVIVGLALGLLGGGGSILMVPLLSYVAGLDPKQAIAISLFVVGVTSLASLLPHARARNVKWGPGLIFAAASMSGAFLGGLGSSLIPGSVLMLAFAVVMMVSARSMIRGRGDAAGAEPSGGSLLLYAPVGLAVGAVTGLVGAGGGFLIVPALTLLAGLTMKHAAGTSLLVISLSSAAGMLGHLNSASINWPLTLSITAAAILGSFIGARLASKVPEKKLRKGFGYFVLAMGLVVLVQELPPTLNLVLPASAAAIAAFWLLYRRITAAPSS